MIKKCRKMICFLLAAYLVFGLAACGGREDAAEPAADTQQEGIRVAYFSATGNTKAVAEQIAAYTEGDLYEIVPAEPYTAEDLDYGDEQSRTSLEMDDPDARPEIGGESLNLEGVSTLYLGYPIWLAYHKLIQCTQIA